ncbi:hypothetical protein HPB50_018074 [Hyalomma asiaticum]|uniref:Uncharacterized protein n=1 Tax=Hyalomma asiaticum TaxID=266040 RepID=A0ACB7SAG0_HYAAI|nr:hypothetical protein HPB50_018074 [Hyalomma asiaticum]
MPSQRDSSKARAGGSRDIGATSSYLNLDDRSVACSNLGALQAADLYPADDCWGGPDQRDLSADKGPPLATGGPPPHNYTDPFPGVLLNNATLGPPPVDHSSAYLHGAGAFGTAACTGLPCNNGSSMSEGPTYGQDFPDYLYSPGAGITGYSGMGNITAGNGMGTMPGMASMGNVTSNVTNSALACTPTDYLLNDLLADEDLHLMDMMSSPTECVSAEVWSELAEFPAAIDGSTFDEFVSADDDVAIMGQLQDEDYVADVVPTTSQSDSNKEIDDGPLPTSSEVISALALVRRPEM